MIIDIKEKRVVVFGLQGSGKSYFTKKLLESPGNKKLKPLIVDPLKEYNTGTVYRPTYRSYEKGLPEINKLIQERLIKPYEANRTHHYLFVIDEANRYAPNKKPLSSELSYLNDFSRHMKLATLYVARRPTQLNTDLVELAHNIIIFNLSGKNDAQYLEDLSYGLGYEVKNLRKHEFMFVDERREYTKCKPIT